MKRLTWADGFYVDYDRDDAYRVTKVRENGATTGVGVLAQFAYDALSRQNTITYGNGTTRSFAYDPISRLSGLQINLTGTAADQTIGQVGGTGTPISYNAASQIASITKSNDAYAYTARTNVSRSYTTNGLNQYTAIGATTLDHDQRGNLTRNGTADYVYDRLNELISAAGLNLSYDPVGRLMQINLSTTTRNYYAGSQLAAEVNTSGAILRRFVPGVGDDAPIIWYEGPTTTNRKFLQADERGSIVAVSDSSGNSLSINSYDEYGASASTGDGGRFRYTGQIWYPEIGLYNYKTRFYSPLLGRFLQTDTIGYSAGMNMYAYVRNDPVNFGDPTGLFDQENIYVTARKQNESSGHGGSFFTGNSGSNSGGLGENRFADKLAKWDDPCTANPIAPECTILVTAPQGDDGEEIIVSAIIPSPPSSLPGGPYTSQPPTPGNRPGNFLGPKQPKGPRPAAQWVPPEGQGGPPGSKGYWKVNLPGQPVQSYDQKGNPFSSRQAAHPNPAPSTRSFFFLGPVGALLCTLFCESPAY